MEAMDAMGNLGRVFRIQNFSERHGQFAMNLTIL